MAEDLKKNFAENLTALRGKAGMTQAQLAEKISYSDKAVSKWERGESIPDVGTLKSIADLFSVTVDYLIVHHDENVADIPEDESSEKKPTVSRKMIILTALIGIFALATLVFISLWLSGHIVWTVYVASIPAALITHLVLNSIWNGGKGNFYIVSLLMLSLIALVYVCFLPKNLWQLFLLAIPSEATIIFGFHIKPGKKR